MQNLHATEFTNICVYLINKQGLFLYVLREYINMYCKRNMYKQGPRHAGDTRKIGQLVEITFGITIILQCFLSFKVPLLLTVGTVDVIFRMSLFLFLTPITYSNDVFFLHFKWKSHTIVHFTVVLVIFLSKIWGQPHTHTHNIGVIVAVNRKLLQPVVVGQWDKAGLGSLLETKLCFSGEQNPAPTF